MSTAAVIGSGVAGLAAAIRLALQDFSVTIFEANSYPGGKLTQVQQDGCRFDAGPSLFTLPNLVDELFYLAGKDPRAYFTYQRLDVITRYFWEDETVLDAFQDVDEFAEELRTKTGEDPGRIKAFLGNSAKLYELSRQVFLESSLHRWQTWFNKDSLGLAFKLHHLDAFRTVNQANSSQFKSPKVVQLFNRYTTYNGSDPYQAPATLNIIPHLEHNLGAYFPKGGMISINKALVKLAEELGVNFQMNTPVRQINTEKGRATGVVTDAGPQNFDLVVSNMDMVNTYQKLLPQAKHPTRMMDQPKSSSALIFYWGIRKQFAQLKLHNIFFSEDYGNEFRHIFKSHDLYSDPTVYLYISSKHNPTDAPDGCENWFTMINVPNNTGQDWEALKQQARSNILQKLSRMLKTEVEPFIETEQILDPILIEQKTSSYQGALYGNSSNNMFSAFLRHPNFSSGIKGLYFCGGSVHPGGGIPLCLLSARITTELIQKREPCP